MKYASLVLSDLDLILVEFSPLDLASMVEKLWRAFYYAHQVYIERRWRKGKSSSRFIFGWLVEILNR